MKIFRAPDVPPELSDPKNFRGTAHTKRAATIEGGEPVTVYEVDFEPGGRTNWHSHTGVQLLLVIDGRGRIQKWGEPIQDIAIGDVVHIAPNEKHWHGASPGTRMAHFAVNLNVKTTWLEPVSEDQYRDRENS
jgi:4-carboxymuconolactone decarboxylase